MLIPRLSKKRKTQKKWLRFIIRYLSHFYNLHECDKSHPPFFNQERQKSVKYYIIWRGSTHFIDSLKRISPSLMLYKPIFYSVAILLGFQQT